MVHGPVNERRRGRYVASAWLKSGSSLSRVRECGNLLRQWCEVKVNAEVAHYAGLRSCGSPWSCPVCSVKIAAARVEEISEATQAAMADGWGVSFLTATFSHHRGQSLDWLLERQQGAWRLLTKSRVWRSAVAKHGLTVAPRIREITEGDANGWHPHIHAAVLTRGWLPEAERLALQASVGAEWRACLVRVGLSGSVEHAFRLDAWDRDQAEDLAGYLAKQLAIEVAGAPFKAGREGRRTPFALLAAAVDGETWAIARWREYEQSTAGLRTIFWPPKWQYRPKTEKSDQELADAEVGGEVVVAFDQAVKAVIWAASPRGIELLELCEEDPYLAVSYVRNHAPPGSDWVVGARCHLEGG